MTAQQQLDELWAFISKPAMLVGVNKVGVFVAHTAGKGQQTFAGTREEIIKQICIERVKVRLS